MTEDLEAIDVLSQKFSDSVKQGRRYESADALVLIDGSPLIAQGEKVLRLYQGEATKAPEDFDVAASMGLHLYRMGWMYYDALLPRYLHRKANGESLAIDAVRNANNTCCYLVQSFELMPNYESAETLADIFRLAGFYGSSIFWLDKAIQNASFREDAEAINKIKARRMDLQADGKVSDPPTSRQILFPTSETVGLAKPLLPTANVSAGAHPTAAQPNAAQPNAAQPNAAQSSTEAKKGGCGVGVVALTVGAVGLGLLTVLTSGSRTQSASFSPPINYASTISVPSSPATTDGDLTEAQMSGKSAFQLDIMRNEIFARHGLRFRGVKRKDLAQHFNAQAWYKPNTYDDDVVWERLSAGEKRRVLFIRNYQKAKGMLNAQPKNRVGTTSVASSFKLLDDETTKGSWFKRVDSTTWTETYRGSGPIDNRFTMKERTTLEGVRGTVVRRQDNLVDLFIPDLGSGSR
jgi:hypothetical protein